MARKNPPVDQVGAQAPDPEAAEAELAAKLAAAAAADAGDVEGQNDNPPPPDEHAERAEVMERERDDALEMLKEAEERLARANAGADLTRPKKGRQGSDACQAKSGTREQQDPHRNARA